MLKSVEVFQTTRPAYCHRGYPAKRNSGARAPASSARAVFPYPADSVYFFPLSDHPIDRWAGFEPATSAPRAKVWLLKSRTGFVFSALCQVELPPEIKVSGTVPLPCSRGRCPCLLCHFNSRTLCFHSTSGIKRFPKTGPPITACAEKGAALLLPRCRPLCTATSLRSAPGTRLHCNSGRHRLPPDCRLSSARRDT